MTESVYFMHFGNFTEDVDERGEVALLSRNILIEGIMGDKCQTRNKAQYKQKCSFKGTSHYHFQDESKDIYGGHIRVRKIIFLSCTVLTKIVFIDDSN